jgi:hypothetical protein
LRGDRALGRAIATGANPFLLLRQMIGPLKNAVLFVDIEWLISQPPIGPPRFDRNEALV